MDDHSTSVLTPTTPRYALRARTPRTPSTSTPTQQVQRSTSTPLKSGHQSQKGTPCSPCTPIDKGNKSATIHRANSCSTPKEKLVFRTPMAFKPRMVGNKPVPSPSRQEMWKEQMGFEDDPSQGSDKENSEDDDGEEEEENKTDHASVVEYRALQKVLAEKTAQRDETLLQNKSYKDKIRQFKSRLERQEVTKRQQLKILRKSHESQLQDKNQLIDNLQSIINEQEERLKELEEAATATPRTRRKAKAQAPAPAPSPSPSPPLQGTCSLIEDIKRLQSDKTSLTTQLNELQFELTTVREDTSREIESLKESLQHHDKVSLHESSLRYNNQSVISQPCSTDTEKQVDVLQAENERLMHDLTEVKQAHTKAVTVSKLSNHRQQQLDEEVRRYKTRVSQLEKDLDLQSQRISDLQSCRQEAVTKMEENVKLNARVRELQAQLIDLQSKTADISLVATATKEVATLKKQNDASKKEMKDLKKTCDDKKQEMYDLSTKVKYLERMLSVTQTQKDDADQSLWREMDSMSEEHQKKMVQLSQQLQRQHDEELRKIENRVSYEHKKELHDVCDSLTAKHKAALTKLEEEYGTLQKDHDSEISRLEEEKSKVLLDMEQEISKTIAQCEEEKTVIHRKHKSDMSKLEEDLTIAKAAAVAQLREQMNKERDTSLKNLQEELGTKHSEHIEQLQEEWNVKTEEALKKQKVETAARTQELETKYSELVQQLALLNPIISEFVEAYILLQKEVKEFPHIIQKTVEKVQKEMIGAIMDISEYNKQLVSKYQKEMKLRKKYHNELVELKGNIRVFCRVRPLIKEDGQGPQAENVVTPDTDDDGMVYVNSKGRVQSFEVDRVFNASSTQSEVFDEVKAIVTSCIDGYNVCIFAYGQTGSGKTYTMEGTPDSPGINQRALGQLFEDTNSRDVDWKYVITVSVIEIYNEMIRDLLSEDPSYKMEVKMNPEGGFHIPGLCFVTVSSVADVNECFQIGQKNRATAATNMNEHSSRSHCLLCVTVIGTNITTGVKTTGKLNLVDLAGSERVSKSKADGARLKEAQNINKSLSCIGDVIYALRSKQSYIPYRNSKLTYLLQDSLGGDSKTLMITQISPVRKNEGETICSLNFAQRVRNVELGAATRKLENGDYTEERVRDYRVCKSDPSSPARTPQRATSGLKPSTPSSTSKLTPLGRQTRRK